MKTGAQGQVAIVLAVDHEAIRMRKLARIAVGDGQSKNDLLAPPHCFAGDRDVVGHNPPDGPRRVIAQEFVDRGADPLRMGDQAAAQFDIPGQTP